MKETLCGALVNNSGHDGKCRERNDGKAWINEETAKGM